MSNFFCEACGAYCEDTPRGYVTGCEHYPPDLFKCLHCGFESGNRIRPNGFHHCLDCGARHRANKTRKLRLLPKEPGEVWERSNTEQIHGEKGNYED